MLNLTKIASTIDDITWSDLKTGSDVEFSTVGATIMGILQNGGKVIIDGGDADVQRSYDSTAEFRKDMIEINSRREEL